MNSSMMGEGKWTQVAEAIQKSLDVGGIWKELRVMTTESLDEGKASHVEVI